jgi:hypothetical protein
MYEARPNVPLPKLRRPTAGARRKYPFDTMAVGAFFFVPGRTPNAFAPHVSATGKKLGRKFSVRAATMMEQLDGNWIVVEADHPYAVAGVGVWRVA